MLFLIDILLNYCIMKKYVYLLAILTLACSCSQNDSLYSYENVNANLDQYLTDKTVSVTVPSGSIAVVTMGENSADTMAIISTSQDIVVPKYVTPNIDYVYATTTASKSFTRANVVDASLYSQLEKNINANYWQVLAFEDSKNGDYDYNDLILHNRFILYKNNDLNIAIHPVALGAAKTINFGYEVYKKSGSTYTYIGGDEIKDVRKSLFLDQSNSGFINTESYQRHYDGYTYTKTFSNCTGNLSDYCVVSYITTGDDSEKIYAINNENAKSVDLFDTNGRPYALVLHGVSTTGYDQYYNGKIQKVGKDWFQYPMEQVRIDDCYDFNSWLQAGDNLDKHIKSGAKVFDVNDNSRLSKAGVAARIYEVASPFILVTDWQ